MEVLIPDDPPDESTALPDVTEHWRERYREYLVRKEREAGDRADQLARRRAGKSRMHDQRLRQNGTAKPARRNL